MDFQNFVNQPIITGPSDKLVLDLINLPSLHMLLGVVDKIITSLEAILFSSLGEGQIWMDRVLKEVLHIGQKCKQGRQALEGNQARKFIKSVDLVERELKKEKEEVVIKGLPLLEAAKSFNKVVEGCMGVELQPDWVVFIESFKEKYLATNMSVTPKVWFGLQCYV